MQRGAISVFVSAIIYTVLAISPSLAHTELVSTNPAANSTVTAAPAQISLTFSETPLLIGSSIQLQQSPDVTIPAAQLSLSGTTISVPWSTAIKPGTVTVNWRVVADDGHVSRGTFKFNYVQKSTDDQVTSAGSSTQWKRYGAIAFLVLIGFIIFAIALANRRRSKEL